MTPFSIKKKTLHFIANFFYIITSTPTHPPTHRTIVAPIDHPLTYLIKENVRDTLDIKEGVISDFADYTVLQVVSGCPSTIRIV